MMVLLFVIGVAFGSFVTNVAVANRNAEREEAVRVLAGEGKIETRWGDGMLEVTDGWHAVPIAISGLVLAACAVRLTAWLVSPLAQLVWESVSGVRRLIGDEATWFCMMFAIAAPVMTVTLLRARRIGRLPPKKTRA